MGWRVEREFIGAIRQQEAVRRTTFADGVRYMEFTEAVRLSLDRGLPIPPPHILIYLDTHGLLTFGSRCLGMIAVTRSRSAMVRRSERDTFTMKSIRFSQVRCTNHGLVICVTAGLLYCLSVGQAHAAVPTGNLLINPGAETGDLTGWTVGGVSNPGVDSGSFDSGINPHTGNFDFYGGSGPEGTLSQDVSLVAGGVTAAEIDSGTLQANVSFWEQGLNQGAPSDDAHVAIAFLDQANTLIGTSLSTNTVDSHEGSWQQFSGAFLIPANTRTITYTMDMTRNDGSDLDTFVDDNVLSVSAVSVVVPEGSTAALLGLALSLIGMVVASRRKRGTSVLRCKA